MRSKKTDKKESKKFLWKQNGTLGWLVMLEKAKKQGEVPLPMLIPILSLHVVNGSMCNGISP